MASYDLEEQEQIDDLKAWWARYGGAIATALLIAGTRRHRRPGLALVDRQARRGCVGAVLRREPGRARQRQRQGEGRDRHSSSTATRAPATRRARRCSTRRCCSTPATARARARSSPGSSTTRRRRAEGDRALPPRRGPARRQAVRRGAATLDAKHPDDPSPASTPTCAATHSRRGPHGRRAHRLRDGARQARRQVAVPQLRRRSSSTRWRARPSSGDIGGNGRCGANAGDGARARVGPSTAAGAAADYRQRRPPRRRTALPRLATCVPQSRRA